MTSLAGSLSTASISELGGMIRRGEITPTALARHALDLLGARGRALNAVVTLTPERALREAARAEAELAAGQDRGPLHGIPYGAKDLLATANIPTTWGAVPYKDQVFDYDAAVVERLELAGAVLVAKLAMVELAGGMGYEQPNASLTGPGRNPWNPDAWSGGSSSGSGSAVGGRLVPFAIGSETQGSITTPAAFCGISGLRPTYGRVSRYGAMALSWTMDKLGPMCRTAHDCGMVLAAIAGRDPRDPTSADRRFTYPARSGRVAGFRLGVLAGPVDAMQPEVAENFDAALDVLREIATLEEVSLPEFPHGAVAGIIIPAEASSAFDELIASGGIADLTAPEDRVRPYSFETISAKDYLRAMRIRRQIAQAMDEWATPYDAIISPTLTVVATPIDESFGTSLRRRAAPLTAAANLAGLPAITVPNGFGERGLPTALQFTGRVWTEQRLLAVANAYQERTDWHLRLPPGAEQDG
jgi:aspartyl-tRNA(Asn)/glutamyl-tRNA(Gln) amidotransferase subunit A